MFIPPSRRAASDRTGEDEDAQRPVVLVAVVAVIAIIIAVLLLVATPGRAAAQGTDERGGFAILKDGDTVVTERFVRAPAGIQGTLHIKNQPRFDYFVATAPGELTTAFTLSIFATGAAESAEPVQRIPMSLHGDTVFAQTTAGAQRIPTRYGAIMSFPNAMSLVELATRRARALGGTGEFPWFSVSNGGTVTAKVTSVGADSMIVVIATQESRFAVDAIGRILGGYIPSQKLTVVRLDASAAANITYAPPASAAAAKPDYSAPADAPYVSEDVQLSGPNGSTIGGTLTKPRGAGPFPVIVTISGSGQQDRDSFIPLAGGIRLFRELADTLGRRGIAVLRVDDRGLGASTGNVITATTADFADDTRAVVRYLRTRKDIDGARIGLLGHSEGGAIAPMVAATDRAIAAVVLMAGPASKGSEISLMQNKYVIDRMPGATQPQKDSLYAVAKAEVARAAVSTPIPWVRYWMSLDPSVAAKQVKAPTLIVQGATDRQVPMAEAEKLAGYVRAGGNRDVTVTIVPNANHLFVPDPDGNFANYNKLPTNRIAPDALGAIADWAVKKLGKAPPRP
jgi:dipeptidyl aminopeptidase/acylaminoacyl peptidase